MSDRGLVRTQPLTFGAAGTLTTVPTATGTNTSNAVPLPRDDYTIQVTVTTTGTSIGSGQVVWQSSNDNVAWITQNTAAGLSTNASTASSVAAAAFAVTAKYAYGRGIVSGTGTSQVAAFMGS